MPIYLVILIAVMSLIFSSFFIIRDAKSFASSPPSPLIDMDTFYDEIYNNIDETTGSTITPEDLKEILDGFIVFLSKQNLLGETIDSNAEKLALVETYDEEKIVDGIVKIKNDLDVPRQSVEAVVKCAMTYLKKIKAVA